MMRIPQYAKKSYQFCNFISPRFRSDMLGIHQYISFQNPGSEKYYTGSENTRWRTYIYSERVGSEQERAKHPAPVFTHQPNQREDRQQTSVYTLDFPK